MVTEATGESKVDDLARLKAITAIGVDKHTEERATARHPTQYATGIVDRPLGRPPRLLDLIKDRFGTVLAGVRRGLEGHDRRQLRWTRLEAS